MATTTEISESPSEEEDVQGFRATVLSEDSRDSLHSEDSGKADLCFRSKFITDELAQVFMDTDSEGEFEGFGREEGSQRSGWTRSTSVNSEADSDEDTGFYSEGEGPAPPRGRSSGLCVAFRFPAKSGPAHRGGAAKRAPRAARPTNRKAAGRGGQRRSARTAARAAESAAKAAAERAPTAAAKSAAKLPKKRPTRAEEADEDEDEDADEDHSLSKRARNIQENKAMLAKLFADLTSMPELLPPPTPSPAKVKKPPPKRRCLPEVQGARRSNPERKARPPEHFGLEEADMEVPPGLLMKRLASLKRVTDKRLLKAYEGKRRQDGSRPVGKKRPPVRPPEDITQDELDYVAKRCVDKIHDKDHGSTCHQCRQKTLDTKTICRGPSCSGRKGMFCGPCLRNRYGEDVRTALLDPTWECPICRGMCNCSLCRGKDGRCATGNLASIARHFGYGSVAEYLESLL